jgi:hypothetical protein
MSRTAIVAIIIILILLGGGFWGGPVGMPYGYGRPTYAFGGLGAILVIVLILALLGFL